MEYLRQPWLGFQFAPPFARGHAGFDGLRPICGLEDEVLPHEYARDDDQASDPHHRHQRCESWVSEVSLQPTLAGGEEDGEGTGPNQRW